VSLWFLWLVWEIFGGLLGGGFLEGGGEGEGDCWEGGFIKRSLCRISGGEI